MQQEKAFKTNQTPLLVSTKKSAAAGKNQSSLLRHVQLFDMPLCCSGMPTVLDWMKHRAQTKNKSIINFLDAHNVNLTFKDDNYRRCLKESDLLLPYGSGVKLALRFQNFKLTNNLSGHDLFPHLCQMAAEAGLSIFLLGAKPGVAWTVAGEMHNQFPELIIAGSHDGFYPEQKNEEIVQIINESGADILLIATGVPRQEVWLEENILKLNTSVNVNVAELFEFYSDRNSRAPAWLRKTGMEWTWSLWRTSPHKLKRHIIGNIKLLIRALIGVVSSKRQSYPIFRLTQSNGAAWRRRFSWWGLNNALPIVKRLLDVSGASLALAFASPLLIITAIAIKSESKGPIFFQQDRVGLRGKTFKFWKFRSMYIDADERRIELLKHNEMQGGVLFKMKADPRITHIGRIIRRFSIDELPQLWNVLLGDMSLVGPRPALPSEVSQYSLFDRKRLTISPGITGIWQVSGRSDIPFEGQVKMDMEYIHSATIMTDLRLLLKTIPAVLSGQGAY